MRMIAAALTNAGVEPVQAVAAVAKRDRGLRGTCCRRSAIVSLPSLFTRGANAAGTRRRGPSRFPCVAILLCSLSALAAIDPDQSCLVVRTKGEVRDRHVELLRPLIRLRHLLP